MHAAIAVLQKCFANVLSEMHAARVRVLLGAVASLLSCRRLVLMDLARAWPEAEHVRPCLKRLDRLLSNRHIMSERNAFYRHMAHWLVGGRLAVIIVDWSPLKADESWHLLRAAMSVGGRTLTLYEEVHSGHAQQSPRVHRAFLRTLRRLLPEKCRPIIVTDAGFRCPWFREVERLGWHFVGRVRNRVYVKLGAQNPWRLTAKLLESRRPLTAFGTIQLVRDQPFSCQLLRYCQVRQRRKHRTVRGQVSKSFASREAARAQREPWLIAYSNSLQAEKALRIVSLYRQRMQIEQSFRDLKCDRFGCAFAYSLTRHAARLSVLLLLHALATFLAWVQGCAQQRQQLTLHCAIRLTAKRAQYSTVRIGWESLRRGQPPTPILQRILRADVMPRWLLNLKPCAC